MDPIQTLFIINFSKNNKMNSSSKLQMEKLVRIMPRHFKLLLQLEQLFLVYIMTGNVTLLRHAVENCLDVVYVTMN